MHNFDKSDANFNKTVAEMQRLEAELDRIALSRAIQGYGMGYAIIVGGWTALLCAYMGWDRFVWAAINAVIYAITLPPLERWLISKSK
jgi:hypothetical protein